MRKRSEMYAGVARDHILIQLRTNIQTAFRITTKIKFYNK